MDERYLWIFQDEVAHQCRLALIAAADIDSALEVVLQPRIGPQRNAAMDRLWFSIHAFLTATANISKLLWPSPRRKNPPLPARAAEVRTSLSVSDDSPLLSRELRDDFEHFDERLEYWVVTWGDSVVDRSIGGSKSDFKSPSCLRCFDYKSWTLTFCGKEYPLRPRINAIRELLEKATDAVPWLALSRE
jgi:hypothetical protein